MLKKTFILTNLLVVSIVFIIIAFLVSQPADSKIKDESEVSSASYSSLVSTETSEEDPMYIMKNSNGLIGIYKYGEDVPIRLLDVSVNGLPEADRNQLNSGIKIYSDEELSRLVEDYNS